MHIKQINGNKLLVIIFIDRVYDGNKWMTYIKFTIIKKLKREGLTRKGTNYDSTFYVTINRGRGLPSITKRYVRRKLKMAGFFLIRRLMQNGKYLILIFC